jgi:citrate lyase beta subunit
MADRERLRRAALFMPGDDLKKITKGAAYGVDAVIMDLEDGVALDHKALARETVARALTSGEVEFGHSERLVRLNAPSSGLLAEDLAATFAGRPDGYMIPKVETAQEIAAVSERLAALESRAGVDPGTTGLIALVETARGVVNLREITNSDPRLMALAFGAEDLAASIGATRTPEAMEVFYARSAVVIHAAAAGLQALDSPCVQLGDTDALRAEAIRAAQMGYSGKLAIHPAQTAVIVEAFRPSEAELGRARRMIAAYEAHQAVGAGVFVFEGQMVDMPMIRAARRVIARGGGSIIDSGAITLPA